MKIKLLSDSNIVVRTGFVFVLAMFMVFSFCLQDVNAEEVEIDFYYGLGGFLGEMVEEFIADFNAEHPDITVRGITYGDYSETLQAFQAGVAASDPPAATMLEPSPTVEFAKRGLLASLNDHLANDTNTDPDDYMQAFFNLTQIDGNQYALPLFGTTQILYYRHDIFEEEGVSPDKLNTWEGMEEAATKLTKFDEEGNVERYGWEPMWGRFNMMDAVFSRGGKILSDDGTEVLLDTEVWIDTWEKFREWIHEDEIMSIHHSGVGWEYWYNTIDDVLEGKAAGYTGSSGDQGDLDFDIVSAHVQPGWEDHGPTKAVGEARYGVVAKGLSEIEEAAAYKFLAYFSSPAKSARWQMETGYLAVRESAKEMEEFSEFLENNPQAMVPLKQLETASSIFIDPTGGEILQALNDAADQVQIENISAKEALEQAAKRAQRALDNELGN
ncbi:MAG: ABC transporter substrate-binding protein [Halanaerobiales bacterium]|nr:ABC transporter substrate-binding protein [Halanaerobiales bacterium]